MKTITMTQIRQEPGKYIHEVRYHGQSFLLTYQGKPVAKLVPVDDVTTFKSDGTVVGEMPLTYRRPELLRR